MIRNESKLAIGIFGGTFNPIHIGHLIMAQEVGLGLGLSQIIFVPAKIQPKKEVNVSPTHRYNMVKLAIADNPYFTASDIELNREEPSYTYITLQLLKKQIQDPIVFIIGSDNVPGLNRWYQWQSLLEEFQFGVGERPGYGKEVVDTIRPHISERAYQNIIKNFVHIPLVSVSASEIRQKCSQGRTIRYLVPAAVEDYIKRNSLYIEKLEARVQNSE